MYWTRYQTRELDDKRLDSTRKRERENDNDELMDIRILHNQTKERNGYIYTSRDKGKEKKVCTSFNRNGKRFENGQDAD